MEEDHSDQMRPLLTAVSAPLLSVSRRLNHHTVTRQPDPGTNRVLPKMVPTVRGDLLHTNRENGAWQRRLCFHRTTLMPGSEVMKRVVSLTPRNLVIKPSKSGFTDSRWKPWTVKSSWKRVFAVRPAAAPFGLSHIHQFYLAVIRSNSLLSFRPLFITLRVQCG